MPNYVNSNNYDLHLVGPDGKKITIRRGSTIQLPQFFDRYVKRGFLKHLRTPQRQTIVAETARPKKYRPSRSLVLRTARKKLQTVAEQGAASGAAQAGVVSGRDRASPANAKATTRAIRRVNKSRTKIRTTKIVGRGFKQGATESLHKTLSATHYPISNGVAAGILSFNRPRSLRRLVNSIIGYTDLAKTTVFISDDGSTDVELHRYLGKLERTQNFVILRNETRLGIAGNTNRLLRCMARFPHKLLLNDDVEILERGWEHFYFKAMKSTGIHHFCFHQPGVYGATEGIPETVGKRSLIRVDVRPHGAIMALDEHIFAKIGFFDETFGYYGMEHVDWSSRVAAARLQPAGFWDVQGSNQYFKIHTDRSAVPDRVKHLRAARVVYDKVAGRATKVQPSSRSEVPAVSCVIPFKDIGRHASIMTAINNVRAQRYPVIEMILVEQDDQSHFGKEELCCMQHLVVRTPGKPFNKSKAFNAGVSQASHPKLLLHDADTLAPAHYLPLVADTLDHAESCHFGARVIYADKQSTDAINKHGRVDRTVSAEKTVTYFEGGSIACLTNTFWGVGGFVEGYWGYGCEDCDFYFRLSKGSRWHENRIVDFIHLWHVRTSGWVKYHQMNKEFERTLIDLSIKDRIKKQHKYFKGTPYAKCVARALAEQQS